MSETDPNPETVAAMIAGAGWPEWHSDCETTAVKAAIVADRLVAAAEEREREAARVSVLAERERYQRVVDLAWRCYCDRDDESSVTSIERELP